ncbi:MAG: glycosyltransferase [Pseudomonadota bacterium]
MSAAINEAPGLSIIVALHQGEANVPAILERLAPARHPDSEFLLCAATADALTPGLVPRLDNVRLLHCPESRLVPHLWRDGIIAAKGRHVALTTAHCLPAADWVERLKAAQDGPWAGVGGTIEVEAQAGALGKAIHLLRYLRFAPPQEARDVADIAADNALYRRAAVLRHDDLLHDGFWEPAFHRRFLAAGQRLRLDPTLRMHLRNRYGARQFIAQRFAHGQAFGRERMAAFPFARRLAYLALSPALPLIVLVKLAALALRRGDRARQLLHALPWLMVFVLAWTLGEASGYAAGLGTEKSKNGA